MLGGGASVARAQELGHGSNYDPPPPIAARPTPTPELPPEAPSESIDWTNRSILLKAALLAGSVTLAWRVARQMRP
jgi:hypothetical protein